MNKNAPILLICFLLGSHKLLFRVGGGLWYSLWTSFGTVTQHNCSHGCPKPMHDMRSKQTKHGNCGPESVHKTGTKVNGKRAKCKNSMATAVGIRVGKTFHIHTHAHLGNVSEMVGWKVSIDTPCFWKPQEQCLDFVLCPRAQPIPGLHEHTYKIF